MAGLLLKISGEDLGGEGSIYGILLNGIDMPRSLRPEQTSPLTSSPAFAATLTNGLVAPVIDPANFAQGHQYSNSTTSSFSTYARAAELRTLTK